MTQWCGMFHLGTAVPLAFAPASQVVTAGTLPVFQMAPRPVWAVLFLVAGVAVLLLSERLGSFPLQLLTWFTVFPLGGLWLTAFSLAVVSGHGSALSIGVWVSLYGPWVVTAVRIALRKG